MGTNFSKKRHNTSIAGKIIITCLLACAAVAASFYISRVTFNKILTTITQLSTPNPKIELVNMLFRDMVKLDQLQRNYALKAAPTDKNLFIGELTGLQIVMDSLRGMYVQNSVQVKRIDSMQEIVLRRNDLFQKYIKLNTNGVKNDTIAGHVKTLSEIVEKSRFRIDSNLVTTTVATKTVIDTLPQEQEKRSLWNRVFVKKKPVVTQVQKKIEEVLQVRVDTMSLGSNGDSLVKIGNAIGQVDLNRLERRNKRIKQQAELNSTGEELIGQLVRILEDVEHDERKYTTLQNTTARSFVKQSVADINKVLLVFVGGTALLVLLIFSDIGRSNRYRKQLIVAKEEAEEAGRVKQRFLANMSHELRTPLQTIIGISEQVKDVAEPRRQDLENMHQSSLHLLQIVNEVLDYSRIVSGKYTLDNIAFNMHRVLTEVSEMIKVQAAIKGLDFHFDAAIAEDRYCSGDPFRLKQVLLNLLGNAVKFTEAGSVSLKATEQLQQDRTTRFTFVTADTGIGMAQKDIGIIFNQFEQVGSSHSLRGTGLGLSIVKSLVEIQGGSINVRSEAGKGSEFTVTLPYTIAEQPGEAGVVAGSFVGYAGYVWVVDDDPFILSLCDSILKKHNIAHTCFSSAREVLATPFPKDLKVVFLDIRMAEMDGITLCAGLRERGTQRPPEFIALTAQVLAEERETILHMGFDKLVTKPFLEWDFLSVLGHAEAPPQANMPAQLDLSAMSRMTGDDGEMLHKILQSYVAETESDMAVVTKSIKNKDADTLADVLHKLASRAGQLGSATLAGKLRIIEIALRRGSSTDDVSADMDTLCVELAATMAEIRKIIRGNTVPT